MARLSSRIVAQLREQSGTSRIITSQIPALWTVPATRAASRSITSSITITASGFLFNITRFRQVPGADGPPGLPVPLWNGQKSFFNTEMYRLTYDWTATPTLLNHLSVGGNHFIKNQVTPDQGQNWGNKVCMKNVIDCTVNFPQAHLHRVHRLGRHCRQRHGTADVVHQRRPELHARET